MEKILNGIRQFHSHVFEQQRERFAELARKQQRPTALLITCSDSRIDPNLVTQTDPGDLFILRNAGNIVPPFGSATRGGETATIEYAISVLGIKNVIVCGHSHCGAMAALMNPDSVRDLPTVSKWVTHAESTRRIMDIKYPGASQGDRMHRAVYENVLVQLDNLRTHPCVAAGVATGDLHLYGWVYVIERGDMLAYDPGRGQFVSLSEATPSPIPPVLRLNQGQDPASAAEANLAT